MKNVLIAAVAAAVLASGVTTASALSTLPVSPKNVPHSLSATTGNGHVALAKKHKHKKHKKATTASTTGKKKHKKQ